MTFEELIKKEIVLLDGGFGTQLTEKMAEVPKVPETVNITHPEIVTAIHRSYIDAGADVIYTCTFGANGYKLKDTEYSVSDLVKAALDNARKAAEGTDTLVALDIGPTGLMMEPNGSMSFDEAYAYFAEIAEAGKDADLVVCETMTDLYEMRAAVLAAKEHTDLPVICTMTFEESGRTFSGTEASSFAVTMTGLGVSALGANCSLGPDKFESIISEISKWTDLPVIAKPNAGLPDPVTGKYNVGPDEFAEKTSSLLKYGVKFVGGCCGTTPEYTRKLRDAIEGKSYVKPEYKERSIVCSAEKIVVIDKPTIIGERINPTGKKALKEAIKAHDLDFVLELALKESQEGAEILDVNAGVPQVDEKKVIVDIIKKLQGTVTEPLQIDSGDPEVMENALRIYAGKAIVNSVNGTEASLSAVLPVAAKYGASVVGLTLDEAGIPKTTEKRIEIAKKILERAMFYGMRKEDVYIDCLTLTVSAEPEGALQTLDALEIVHKELGLKTVLGVSNISFGLPARPLVNAAFLQMALAKGLDLPIMNPGDPEMMKVMDTNALISNIDKEAKSFISRYSSWTPGEAPVSSENTSKGQNNENDLVYLVENGLEEQTLEKVRGYLASEDPMTVINERLIPVLDKTGEDFEKGRIFIPQLLTASKTAQRAFDEIKQRISSGGNNRTSQGLVVIATVKGDVHDIGKNIAKVVMDNYGYDVLDLGKDVDPEVIADKVKETGARLVGLSALMTTTLPNMEKTVKLIKEKAPGCLIMAGGAVVTADYAKRIGCDFYVKDAMSSAKAAQESYGR